MSDSEGFLWVLAIGATVWAWSNHEKLQSEREERIFAIQKAETRNEDLKTRVLALERELLSAKETANIAVSAVSAVSDRVSNNAKVANENAVRDMTRRGACGTKLVQDAPGVYRSENIPCTAKDLEP